MYIIYEDNTFDTGFAVFIGKLEDFEPWYVNECCWMVPGTFNQE